MAVIRQANLLGQQRLDIPHVRAIESAVAGDFDVLAGQMLAGEQAVVLSGFRLSTSTAGGAATDLKLQVAGSMMMHFNASESGTVFSVPADRADEELTSVNTKVIGSFTANQTNYIGIDFRRAADSTTADLVQFIDPTTGKETSATVPLARTLDYRIYISTTNFDQMPNVCPVAKVVTDTSNNVASIADARQMMFRLGTGGTSGSTSYVYPWAQGRNESTAVDGWSGGDKAIGSMKEWQDAVMTRLWELGGGEYWYANAADRNVNMIGTGTTFSNGEYFVWTLGTSNLVWKGLRFLFDNSAANYNVVQDDGSVGVTLADGDCLYVDLNRTNNGATVIPVKGTLATLGTSTIPGNRYVMAWRNGNSVYTRGWRYAVGATFTPATTTSTGVVKLNNTPLLDGSGNPTVVSIMSNGQAEVTATANNSHGIKGTGHGSGPGVWAVAAGANALSSYGGLYNHDSTGDWATVTRYVSSAFGPALYSRKSRSSTIGGLSVVQSGDTLMALIAQGANGTGYTTAAQITAEVDGTPGATNDMPGRLVFSTTADGSGTVTERMRISSTGSMLHTYPSLAVPSLTWGAAAGQTFRNENAELAIGQNVAPGPYSIWLQGRGSTPTTSRDLSFQPVGGNVGVGTIAPSVNLHVVGPDSTNTWVRAQSAAGISLFSGFRHNGTRSSPTIVLNGDELARFEGRGYDAGATTPDFRQAASIHIAVDGTPGENDMPGRIVFNTTPDGSNISTERMRITASGNVGIGVTPAERLHIYGGSVRHEDVLPIYGMQAYTSVAALAGTLGFQRSKSATIGTNTIVAADDLLGMVSFSGANGTGYTPAASVRGYVDGAPGTTNDMPGRLSFWTTPDATGVSVERVRISNSGTVTINSPTGGANALVANGDISLSGTNTEYKYTSSRSRQLLIWGPNYMSSNAITPYVAGGAGIFPYVMQSVTTGTSNVQYDLRLPIGFESGSRTIISGLEFYVKNTDGTSKQLDVSLHVMDTSTFALTTCLTNLGGTPIQNASTASMSSGGTTVWYGLTNALIDTNTAFPRDASAMLLTIRWPVTTSTGSIQLHAVRVTYNQYEVSGVC